MSIDWITVAAQIANFLVLVWLLKRFLYRPILDGIDAREAEITNRMQEAVKAKEEADAIKSEFNDKLRVLHTEEAEMSEAIRKSAEEQRGALLAEAHDRLEREHVSWQAHLDEEAHDFATKMHRAGAGALLSLTRKALADLADEQFEARIASHLAQKIKPMAAELNAAAGEARMALVLSHGPLPASVKDSLTTELGSVFPGIDVEFATDAEQAPGLVLRIGGAQLAWTLDSYIDGLEALIGEKLATATDLKDHAHER